MPYTKGLSEEIAHKMRKQNIDVVHKPTATIKNILCRKAKDKLHPMDKSGAIYSIKCRAHGDHYIGETGRAARERFYEHRVMSHKDAKRSSFFASSKISWKNIENSLSYGEKTSKTQFFTLPRVENRSRDKPLR